MSGPKEPSPRTGTEGRFFSVHRRHAGSVVEADSDRSPDAGSHEAEPLGQPGGRVVPHPAAPLRKPSGGDRLSHSSSRRGGGEALATVCRHGQHAQLGEFTPLLVAGHGRGNSRIGMAGPPPGGELNPLDNHDARMSEGVRRHPQARCPGEACTIHPRTLFQLVPRMAVGRPEAAVPLAHWWWTEKNRPRVPGWGAAHSAFRGVSLPTVKAALVSPTDPVRLSDRTGAPLPLCNVAASRQCASQHAISARTSTAPPGSVSPMCQSACDLSPNFDRTAATVTGSGNDPQS